MQPDVSWLVILLFLGLLISIIARVAYKSAGLNADGTPLPERTPRALPHQAVMRPHTPVPIAAAPSEPPPPLPLRSWLDAVNHQPDRNPHVVITGPTGSGKTTLTLAMLTDRPGQLVIVTPKARRADPWGGLPAVRLRPEDMSFQPLADAVQAVHAEMLRRNAHETDVDATWLTLVIDEYPTVAADLKGLADTVLRMLRLARSVRIRLLLIASETSVKALGLEGNGAARDNCIFVTLDEDRHATIARWGKAPQPMDTSMVPTLAQHTLSLARWWQVPQDTRSSLLASPPPRTAGTIPGPLRPIRAARLAFLDDGDQTGLAGLQQPHAETSRSDLEAETTPTPSTPAGGLDAEIIRTLYAAGWSKNKICAKMTGAKDKKLAIIAAALAAAETVEG